MILTIDIGNTNIVLGCIDGDKTLFVERLSTVRTKTELEYAIDIKNVLDISTPQNICPIILDLYEVCFIC